MVASMLLITAAAASAQDVEILIDGSPIAKSYVAKPGGQLEVTTRIDAGVLIREVSIKSDNPFFQEILGHAFDSAGFHRDAVAQENKAMVILPETVPAGRSSISINIRYDKDFEDRTYRTDTTLDIDGGSRILGLLSKVVTEQTATELSNWLTGYQIPRANPELTIDDLSKEDLAALGITTGDYLQTIALAKEASMLLAEGKAPESEALMAASRRKLPSIKEIASVETTPELGELKVRSPKGADELDGPITPLVTLTAKTYLVSAGENQITKSKITASVFSPENEGISKVSTVVLIPKEVAKTAADVDFGQTPTIIDPDPVVKWAFKNIPQDQAKDYTFTLNQDVQNFEVLASATAERPSLMFRIIKWIIERFMERPASP